MKRPLAQYRKLGPLVSQRQERTFTPECNLVLKIGFNEATKPDNEAMRDIRESIESAINLTYDNEVSERDIFLIQDVDLAADYSVYINMFGSDVTMQSMDVGLSRNLRIINDFLSRLERDIDDSTMITQKNLYTGDAARLAQVGA